MILVAPDADSATLVVGDPRSTPNVDPSRDPNLPEPSKLPPVPGCLECGG